MLETLLGILGTVMLAVVGWAFQLSNRVTKLEAKEESVKSYLDTKFEEVNRRLDRIERKIYNGGTGV